ncbi:hypothetical protein ACFW1A_39940 [Kitasatospora sp. NPDC058965]|uniref:hypothetical protein n=1 Tax=Kitasatospora sp. NPDC058965 TaxID=3346682 RepID=UPI0036BF87A0
MSTKLQACAVSVAAALPIGAVLLCLALPPVDTPDRTQPAERHTPGPAPGRHRPVHGPFGLAGRFP